MTKHKDDIIKLASEGYSYNGIQAELGCSKGTISYHLGEGQKSKSRLAQRRRAAGQSPLARRLGKRKWEFGEKEAIEKFGQFPTCYLTGETLEWSDSTTYEFDHIIPKSRGGGDTIDNAGVLTPQVNAMKHDLTPDELIDLCIRILRHSGYVVQKL